jgi:two-component system sensor histidine kinase YesM
VKKREIGRVNSIFTSLLVIFIAVVIPLYFLGVNIIEQSKKILRQEISNSMQIRISNHLDRLEDDIGRIKKMAYDCFTDDDLINLASTNQLMDSYDRAKAVSKIQGRLTSLKDSSAYIQNVSVFIPSVGWAIYAKGSGRGAYSELTEEQYDRWANIYAGTESQLTYYDGRLSLTVFYPSAVILNKTPSIVIETELSEGALVNALMPVDQNNGDNSVLFSAEQDFLISRRADEAITGQITELIHISPADNKGGAVSASVGGENYLLFYQRSGYLGLTLAQYMLEDAALRPLIQFQRWYLIFTAALGLLFIFYSAAVYWRIQSPISKLVRSFKNVKEGDLKTQIHYGYKDEFGYLYGGFNEMVENINNLINQVYSQKILARDAELKQLQSQINPHFLYNSFFILKRKIAKGDSEAAEQFCDILGVYFKYITRNASDTAALSNEAEHARIYADIQSMRFSNRIKVEFGDLPAKYKNLPVPRLILQPIIENAFEHGLEDKENGGLLRISFSESGPCLHITVEDNGNALTDETLEKLKESLDSNGENLENTGILNIHKRIRLAMGEKCGVNLSRSPFGGLMADICIMAEEPEVI